MEKNNKINYNESRAFKSRLDAISELAIRNEIPFQKVIKHYLKANYAVYRSAGRERKGNKASFYNPILEDKVFELTERYIDSEKYKALRKLAEALGQKFSSVRIPRDINRLIEGNNPSSKP